MNQLEQDIQEVTLSLEEAKKLVAFGEAISRLEKNKDYRLVFADGYFRDEAARLTMLSAERNLTQDQRDNVLHSIRSIGELGVFLRMRVTQAEMAKTAIGDAEEFLEQVHQQEADDTTDAGDEA